MLNDSIYIIINHADEIKIRAARTLLYHKIKIDSAKTEYAFRRVAVGTELNEINLKTIGYGLWSFCFIGYEESSV